MFRNIGFLLVLAAAVLRGDEVLPGVWRVGGTTWGIKGFPTISVKGDSNVYLIQLPKGMMLLDCGTVDGMPAKILRANGIFRALILPQGAQKVVFTFEPARGMVRRYLLQRGLISANNG